MLTKRWHERKAKSFAKNILNYLWQVYGTKVHVTWTHGKVSCVEYGTAELMAGILMHQYSMKLAVPAMKLYWETGYSEGHNIKRRMWKVFEDKTYIDYESVYMLVMHEFAHVMHIEYLIHHQNRDLSGIKPHGHDFTDIYTSLLRKHPYSYMRRFVP